MVHLVGEGWVEVQDGDDVCDAEGGCDGWVLGGVEVAEVDSGDYEVWAADWGFWGWGWGWCFGWCWWSVHGSRCSRGLLAGKVRGEGRRVEGGGGRVEVVWATPPLSVVGFLLVAVSLIYVRPVYVCPWVLAQRPPPLLIWIRSHGHSLLRTPRYLSRAPSLPPTGQPVHCTVRKVRSTFA